MSHLLPRAYGRCDSCQLQGVAQADRDGASRRAQAAAYKVFAARNHRPFVGIQLHLSAGAGRALTQVMQGHIIKASKLGLVHRQFNLHGSCLCRRSCCTADATSGAASQQREPFLEAHHGQDLRNNLQFDQKRLPFTNPAAIAPQSWLTNAECCS